MFFRHNDSTSPTQDYSGNGNDGTWSGSIGRINDGVTKTNGDWGTGHAQSLSSNAYINVSDDTSLEGTNLTAAIWYRHQSNCGTYNCWFFSKWNDNFQGFGIGFTDSNTARFWLRDGDSDTVNVDASAGIRDGNWHHVVLRFDARTGNLSAYVDGDHLSSAVDSTVDGYADTAEPLRIGSPVVSDNFPEFDVDESHYYVDRVLTSSEISHLYNYNQLTQPDIDSEPPFVRNTGQNMSTIQRNEYVDLFSQGNDTDRGLSDAIVSINDTGEFVNYTRSPDNNGFTQYPNPVLSGEDVSWGTRVENFGVAHYPNGTIAKVDGYYWGAYDSDTGTEECVGVAKSKDLVNWEDYDGNPVLCPSDTNAETFESSRVKNPEPVVMPGEQHTAYMFYVGYDGSTQSMGVAYTDNMTDYTRNTSVNPMAENFGDTDSNGVEDITIVNETETGRWLLSYEEDSSSNSNVRYGLNEDPVPWTNSWTDEGWVFSEDDSMVSSYNCQKEANPRLVSYNNGTDTIYNLFYECLNSGNFSEEDNLVLGAWSLNFTDSTAWTQEGLIAKMEYPSWQDENDADGGLIPNGGGQIGDKIRLFFSADRVEDIDAGTTLGNSLHDNTVLYGSEQTYPDNPTNTWEWANFSYSAPGFINNETVEWKIWWGDGNNNYNVTSTQSLTYSNTTDTGTADTAPPSITIHDPQNQTYSTSTLDLNVTADEPVDAWQKSVDGGANETFQPNTTISGLSEGTHTVDVYANDSEGNTGKSSVTFTVDTTDPTVTYNPSSTASGTINRDWILVNVSASDNLGLDTVTEQFDGANASFLNGAGEHYWTNHTGLADGTYPVQGFAADNAGNIDSTGEREITVDTSGLTVTVYSPENTTYDTDTVDLKVTADTTVDSWEYSLNGGSNTTFTPNTTISGLSDGTHTVDVYANDSEGNIDGESVTFTVDTSDSGSDPGTDPAFFDVNITGTNSPVVEGEILNVSASIENTGDESATQNVTLEIDGEQVDSTSGSLSGGQSTSVTFTYLTVDGDGGNRTATVASDDDTDSTSVTIEPEDGDDDSDGDDGTGTSGGSPSSSPSDGGLQNITVSSAVHELTVGTTVTGSVLAENPHDANVTLEIMSAMDASCDYIALVDEDGSGTVEYDLPANTTRSIGYEIDLTGIDADTLQPGDSVTCEYEVSIPGGADTSFEITAEIRSPGLFSGLSITGLTGGSGVSSGTVLGGFLLLVAFISGVAWFRVTGRSGRRQ